MAPINPTDNALDGLTPAAEEGVNILVTYQLRKENAAILEKQAANERMIQACITATNQHFQHVNERLDALDVKLSELESNENKDREAIEEWGAEARLLKRQIEEGLGKQSSAPEASAESGERQTAEISSTSARTQAPPSTTTSTSARSNELVSDDTRTANRHIPNPPQNPTVNTHTTRRVAARISSHGTQNQPPKTAEPRVLRIRQPEAQSREDHPIPIKLPRLVQGTSQLRTYFKRADTAFATVPKDVKMEVEFIAAFLKGLQQGKQRESLSRALLQQHPSRMGSNGKVEVMCKWQDVGDGLRQIGLLETDGQAGPPAKKRKILIPREMVEAGMMR